MNRLIALREGDIVDVIAPGSACARQDLQSALGLLERWKLQPRVPEDIFGPSDICAHKDEVRWRHLEAALTAADSKAIWCVRGGYGSLRLMRYLEQLRKPRRRKLLIGFSDVTALQVYITERWKWPVLHGPVLAQLGRGEPSSRDVQELKRVLFGNQKSLVFDGLRPLVPNVGRRPSIRARFLGGNMKTIQSLLGTPWQPPATRGVWFFEDVNERGYSVDRMLQHMRLAGLFANTKAIVLGSFLRGEEPDGRRLAIPICREFARSVAFPVFTGLAVGHGKRLRPLPLGLMTELELRERARLTIEWT